MRLGSSLKKALYDGNIDVLGEVLNQNWNLKKVWLQEYLMID